MKRKGTTMKRLFLLIAMVATVTVHAQVSFGVKAGVNWGNERIVNSGLTFLPTTLTSFHGGVYMEAKFGKFAVQPEIVYSRLGGVYNNSFFTGSIITDYFTIPVLLNYSITKKVTLQLGPQLGVLNMAKRTIDGATTDTQYRYKTGDFGIAIGFNVKLPHRLNVGVRYVAGLRDINSGNVGGPGSATTNHVIQLSLGYRLFGKE
jgi:hypothetical protein